MPTTRRLRAGEQLLLVVAHLRKGEIYMSGSEQTVSPACSSSCTIGSTRALVAEENIGHDLCRTSTRRRSSASNGILIHHLRGRSGRVRRAGLLAK
jgi:hypothetical protein